MFGGVYLIREFVFVQIIDGLEEFNMADYLIVGRDDDEHTVLFGPKAVLLESLTKERLGKNAARKEVTPVVNIQVIGVELVKVGVVPRPQCDNVTFEHHIFFTILISELARAMERLYNFSKLLPPLPTIVENISRLKLAQTLAHLAAVSARMGLTRQE
jgi:hypothetical protein